MYRTWHADCALIIFAGIFSCSFAASAMDIAPNASIGMQYTDNVTLVPDNEVSELIVNASAGAAIDAGSGPYRFNANTSISNEHYTRGTFADQQYFNLGATAGWEMLKNRVDWTLQDFFSQQSINSLQPDTPDNIQDTNVFTFGPNIQFPISSRQSVIVIPEYRKFTYDVESVDNQQNSLNASWNYQMFRTMSVGLRGEVSKVEYDDQTISDTKFTSVSMTASGKRFRSDYSFDLGVTHVVREDDDSSFRGMSGNLTWSLDLSGYSQLRTIITSGLTNSSDSLLNAARNPGDGDFSNQQITNEVVRNSVLRVAYNRKDATLSSNVWIEFLNQNYEQSLIDQDVQSFGLEFSYPLTAALSTGINTRYNSTDLTDVDQQDDEYSVSGNLNYRLSRNLSTVLDLRYQDKNSTLDTLDFKEVSVFINLVYGSLSR